MVLDVFAGGIAKYFSNALREDCLLARSTAGMVVAVRAAGTVQEIFQVATRLNYAAPDGPVPPLVLLGREHWTRTLPVAPLLYALGRGRWPVPCTSTRRSPCCRGELFGSGSST